MAGLDPAICRRALFADVPVAYRNKTRDANSAASTTGAGNKKNNAVNNPVAATTNDNAGGLRSNAATGASKYITLITRM
jgi:hypothetical protein